MERRPKRRMPLKSWGNIRRIRTAHFRHFVCSLSIVSAIRSFDMIRDATLQEGPPRRMMVARHCINDYWERQRISSTVVESLRVTESATGEAVREPPASAKRIISEKHASLPVVDLFLIDFYLKSYQHFTCENDYVYSRASSLLDSGPIKGIPKATLA